MIDEKSLRRLGFDESNCTPVVLPDGNTYLLPRPRLSLQPVFVGGRRVRDQAALCSDEPEFEELKRAFAATIDDPNADWVGAAIDLAAYMLLKAYALTDEQLGAIFGIARDAPLDLDWIKNVMAVTYGQAPKPSAVG